MYERKKPESVQIREDPLGRGRSHAPRISSLRGGKEKTDPLQDLLGKGRHPPQGGLFWGIESVSKRAQLYSKSQSEGRGSRYKEALQKGGEEALQGGTVCQSQRRDTPSSRAGKGPLN